MQSVWERAKPIYVALLLALLTWVALQALAELTHVLLILFVAILFAAALTGPVRWLNTRSLSSVTRRPKMRSGTKASATPTKGFATTTARSRRGTSR